MSKFDINKLNFSTILRDPNKKLSYEDLKDLPIYIFGYDKEKRFKIVAEPSEHLVLIGACTYYGMSTRCKKYNQILKESMVVNHDCNRYISIPDYDKEHFIIQDIEGYYVPTEARCIIDCIRYKDIYFDEEQFLIAINDYFDLDRTLDELYEVGDYFKVPRKEIDYWITRSDIVNYED